MAEPRDATTTAAFDVRHSDAIASGVVIADAGGVIVGCNRAATEIMGLPAEQIRGKSLTHTNWWPAQPFFEDGSPLGGLALQWLNALRAGQPVPPQVIGARAEGQSEPVWLLLSARPLPLDAAGSPTGLVLTITDITLQKRAEALYAQAADELHAVLHALPDLYLRLDADGTIVDYSIGAGFDAYVTSDDLIGRHIDEFMPPGISAQWRKAIAAARLSGEVQTLETSFETTRVGLAYFQGRCGRLPDGGSVVLIRDVTAQRLAQDELARSERVYRTVFERAQVGMFTYDPALRITGCNDAFAHMTGLPREHFVGLEIDSLKERRILPCLRVALAGEDGRYEGPYVPTSSGFGGTVSMYTQAILDADGAVAGGLAVVVRMADRFPAGAATESTEHPPPAGD